MDFQLFLSCILHARNDIGREEVGKILDLLPSSQQEDVMAGLAQEFRDDWYAKGKAEGIEEGITQGVVEGEAKLLIRQLERRFGALSEENRQRVLQADANTLEHWGDLILEAASLDEILGCSK